jgi:hypothetical protein
MTTVVSTKNLIKANGLNHYEFQQMLADTELQYGDMTYLCDVHWLSESDILRRAYIMLK